jgi:hypothetical protein
MSESLPSSSPCRDRQAAVSALFLVGFLTALLWAGGALPAQATTGGVPAAPHADSDRGNAGNGGQGHGAGGVAGLPDAAPDDGSSEVVPPPPDPALQGAGQDGGANDTSAGPYDPDPADPGASGVGQPSGNGKSTENSGKRPCAGCVGKADYKNPPGQLPDGSDHNKGYECDENQGVGKMNPAHSGCAPGAAPSQISPPTPAVTPPAAAPPESPPRKAGAEEQGEVQGVEQGPELPEAPAAPPAVAVLPVSAVVTPAAEQLEKLPLTGGQPLFLGVLGLLMLVAGLGMARLLRTRSHA